MGAGADADDVDTLRERETYIAGSIGGGDGTTCHIEHRYHSGLRDARNEEQVALGVQGSVTAVGVYRILTESVLSTN